VRGEERKRENEKMRNEEEEKRGGAEFKVGKDTIHVPASPAALRRCRTGETVKVMVHSGLTARIN